MCINYVMQAALEVAKPVADPLHATNVMQIHCLDDDTVPPRPMALLLHVGTVYENPHLGRTCRRNMVTVGLLAVGCIGAIYYMIITAPRAH